MYGKKNIDWGLFRRLAPFRMIGGVAGAYLLSSLDASAASRSCCST